METRPKTKLTIEIEKLWADGSKNVVDIKARLKINGIEFKSKQISKKLYLLRNGNKYVSKFRKFKYDQALKIGVQEIMDGFSKKGKCYE